MCIVCLYQHNKATKQKIKFPFQLTFKAFQLMEYIDGSQKNFLDILKFAKDIYCSFKGDTNTIKKWPDSWYACNVILKNSGYKEPITIIFV